MYYNFFCKLGKSNVESRIGNFVPIFELIGFEMICSISYVLEESSVEIPRNN